MDWCPIQHVFSPRPCVFKKAFTEDENVSFVNPPFRQVKGNKVKLFSVPHQCHEKICP